MEKLTSYSYWNETSKMNNIHGVPKFEDVSRMAKTFMCLTHGNATPERGFSENKDHRSSMDDDTIVSIRMVKDFLKYYENVSKFPISNRLLTLCRSAHQKYLEFLELQKQEEKKKKLKEDKIQAAQKLQEIDRSIKNEN